MEDYATSKQRRTLLIRRIVAILLTAAALFAMFLPMLTLSDDVQSMFRKLKKDNGGDSVRQIIKDLPYRFQRELRSDGYSSEYTEFFTEKIEKIVKQAVLPAYGKLEDNRITMLDNFTIAGAPGKALSIFTQDNDDLEEILADDGYSDDEIDDVADEMNKLKSMQTLANILPIAVYVLFFLTIAFGVAAIVMYILNKSKTFGVLFAVFALLLVLLFVAAIIVPRVILGKTDITEMLDVSEGSLTESVLDRTSTLLTGLLPGLGLILLPVLALAGVIVYKKDKSYKGILPPKEQKQQTVVVGPEPEDPWGSGHGQPPQGEWGHTDSPDVPADSWVCPVCGGVNENSSAFCIMCGSRKQEQKAEPVPKPKFCGNCGAQLEPGSLFCINCGAKQ